MNCKNCGAEFQENVNFCPFCGERTEEVEAVGMKWHKFKAYFIMPLSAIVNLLVGVLLFPCVMNKLIELIPDSASLYATNGYPLVLIFDSVKVVNTVFAFVSVTLAFYCAYVSFVLIKYKKGAIRHIYISLVISEVSGAIYSAAVLIVMNVAFGFRAESMLELAENLISLVVTVVFWLFVYTKYYEKRKHMFLN